MHAPLRAHFTQALPLSDEEFAAVLAQGTFRTFRRRHYLVREGQRVPEVYLVLAGLVKLVHTDPAGKAHVLSFAWEDWWESDFQAYFTSAPATVALQCLEATTAWCLPLAGFRQLCASQPRLTQFFLDKALRGGWATRQRLVSLLALPARARYEQVCREQPGLVRRLSKVQLAAYLGVSRELLSRWARPPKKVR